MSEPAIRELPLDLLDTHPRNPRREPGDLRELAASIRELGVLEPIVVVARGDRFAVVMGTRRVAAARIAERATAPAIVREYTDDEAAIAALVENVQRRDLSPLDEAAALAETLRGMSQRELARRIGKSQPFVANRVRLLGLAPVAREAIRRGIITPAAALETLRVRDPELVGRLPLRADVSVIELRARIDALLRKQRAPVKKKVRRTKPDPEPPPKPTTRRLAISIRLLDRLTNARGAAARRRAESAVVRAILESLGGRD